MARGANTQDKNSGILRFTFGYNDEHGARQDVNFLPIVGGAAPRIVNCLGADADVTPDWDDQVFGESPGHAAITGAANTLFSGSNVAQRDASPVGQRVQGNPETGAGPVGGSRAGARIPAGTKVLAWFQASDVSMAGTTVGTDIPFVCVMTEVVQNRMYRAGALATTGPEWLSSIRVALVNQGGAETIVAGALYVKLQHSHLDIPSELSQSIVDLATTPT